MASELIRAIRAGDVDAVWRLLDAGADPNEKLWEELDHGPFLEGVTPLMVAAAAPKSNVEIVRLLLERGADPFAVSDGEVTALWYAAGGGTGYPWTGKDAAAEPDHPYQYWGGGDAARLRLLLETGLKADEAAGNGRTAVGEACKVGDPIRLAALINHGGSVLPARVGAQAAYLPPQFRKMIERSGSADDLLSNDPNGYASYAVPLFLAAESGCAECVRLILAHGFPADFRCGGETALDHASTVEVVEILWNAGLRPSKGRFGFDPLDGAFENERYAVAAFLIEKTPLEQRVDLLHQKLLSCSGVRMNPDAVKMLLELGADPKRPDKDYGSALHTAAWQGDGNSGRENSVVEATLRLLLDAGADPNMPSDRGTPLHEAVEGDWGSPTSVRVLLEAGADPNAADREGRTPLMIAADKGEVECIRLLLAGGADRTLRDHRHKAAIDYAYANLETWRGIVRKPPRGPRRIFNLFGLDYDPEAMATSHHQAYEDAVAVVQMLRDGAQFQSPAWNAPRISARTPKRAVSCRRHPGRASNP
ncbi:hypothetical protein EON82_03115 [bacterium]|nr:MAG: hypothetical protein EON82_03115 [bacterium]